MTQYYVQKGLRVFGEAGAVGVKKELQQLHDCKLPEPVHPEGLSKNQFAKVLEYFMFLKEKCSGVINRKCTKEAPWLIARRMSLTLHLLLFAQSM